MSGFDPAIPGAGAGAIPAEPDSGITFTREPWQAVCWNFVFPGLGHVRLGRRVPGLALVAGTLAISLLAIVLATRESVSVLWAAVCVAGLAAIQAGAGFHAHGIARVGETPVAAAARHARRDAWKALFLTRLLPGAGHLYDGRYPVGIALVVLTGLTGLLHSGWGAAGQVVLVIAGSLELWRNFRGRPGGSGAAMVRLVTATAAVMLLASALTAGLRAYVVRAYRMPSESMLPSVAVGDCLFADMTRRGHASVGEIVVFPVPGDPSKEFLKRVFATAGDIVEFRADGAWRNGRLAIRPPVLPPVRDGQLRYGGEGRPYSVPQGAVFVIGDNLGNSSDSRFFGPVPEASVRGRAYKIYWPLEHEGPIAGPPGAVPGGQEPGAAR